MFDEWNIKLSGHSKSKLKVTEFSYLFIWIILWIIWIISTKLIFEHNCANRKHIFSKFLIFCVFNQSICYIVIEKVCLLHKSNFCGPKLKFYKFSNVDGKKSSIPIFLIFVLFFCLSSYMLKIVEISNRWM